MADPTPTGEDNVVSLRRVIPDVLFLGSPMDHAPLTCEFCGGEMLIHPDDQEWRVLDLEGKLHRFCSYLCKIRWVLMYKKGHFES